MRSSRRRWRSSSGRPAQSRQAHPDRACQSLPGIQGGRGRLSEGTGPARASRRAARNAAHDSQTQGHRAPASGHQGADQGSLRRARRRPQGRCARRPIAGRSPRRRRPGRADRAAQFRQVLAAFATHRLRGTCRGVPLHDPIPRARHDAARGHPVSAGRPAGAVAGASRALARRRAADGRRGTSGDRPGRSRVPRADPGGGSPPQGEAPDIDGELESGRLGRRSFRANASDADPCEQGGRDSRNRRRARGVSRTGRISLSRAGRLRLERPRTGRGRDRGSSRNWTS